MESRNSEANGLIGELRGKRTNRSKCCSILQSLENAYRQVECSRHGIADLVKFAFFVLACGELCVNTLRNTLLMLLQTSSCGSVCPEETIGESPKFFSFF